MKNFHVLFVLFYFICGNSLAQTNPVEKSICIYLKKVERQSKIDTLYVMYENDRLLKYKIPKIRKIIIKECGYAPSNRMFISLNLEEMGNNARVIVIEKVTTFNEKNGELDIFTSGALNVNFGLKKGKWKYLSNAIQNI